MGRHAIVWLAHLHVRLVQVEVRIETGTDGGILEALFARGGGSASR